MSGTAVALPATDTVFGDDIVNGQVKTQDISDTNGVRSADVRDDDKNGGGLAAVDLARNSVGRSEIATDGVSSREIELDAIRRPEIATDGVGSPEIARDAVRGPEIAPNGVGASEIAPDGVGESEIATDSVSASEVAPQSLTGDEIRNLTGDDINEDAVGSNELADVFERATPEVSVEDGTAGDGTYGIGSVFVSCEFGFQEFLSASIEWTDTNGRREAMLQDVEILRDQPGLDGAIVTGIFDGGGGDANPAKFIANATCLQN
jgi:hypothetical protein